MALTSDTLFLGERSMTLDDVRNIAHGRTSFELSEKARDAVARGREAVDRLVRNKVPAYGITTGVGSQKDFSVDPQAIGRYNDLMLTGHATFAPGPDVPRTVVRIALAIQLSLFARGRSGVRPVLVDSLLARLQEDDLPHARLGSSVGASDIVAMSQMAIPLIGRGPAGFGGGGPIPLQGLAAKEAISLLNSNSLMLAQGTLALLDVRALLDAASQAAAMSMEGFRGNLRSWSEAVDLARGQPGQSRTGQMLRTYLAESRLWSDGEARFLQDPLSFRCVPQIHGAAEAAYNFTASIFEAELAALCDNPLIVDSAETFISHGNMESSACCIAMDTMRQAMAKVIEASGQRIHKIQWPGFTGLPTSLATEAGAIGGVQFLNFGHIAAANVGAVRQAASPALLNYSGQIDDGVEDVAGNAPQSVAETVRSLEAAWNVVALETACAVWAINRRAIAIESLGSGLRQLASVVLELLPIGLEGESVFDLKPIVEAVKASVNSVSGELQ